MTMVYEFNARVVFDSVKDDKKYYNINIECDGDIWTVCRSMDDFVNLDQTIRNYKHALPTFSRTCSENILNAYLSEVLHQYKDDLWTYPVLVRFLDNGCSFVQQAQIAQMNSTIKFLQEENIVYEATINALSAKYSDMIDILKKLTAERVEGDDLTYDLLMDDAPFDRTRSISASTTASSEHRSSSYSLLSSAGSGLTDSATSSRSFIEVNVKNDESALTKQILTTASKFNACLRENSAFKKTEECGSDSDSSTISSQQGGDTTSSESSSDHAADQAVPVQVAATQKKVEVITPVACSDPLTAVAHEIVDTLSQHESQLRYRASVVNFVKRYVRTALSVNVFDFALNELHCSLPDDVLKLSVIVNKQDAANWYKSVLDKLTAASERTAEDVVNDTGANDVNCQSNVSNAWLTRMALPHTVQNVQLTTSKQSYKVTCLIDNNVSIEIIANNRSELGFLAFFEEIDVLVGKDHLFKRSVLLIRAWWVYETKNYIDLCIKHYIPDSSLCVMITSVFNRHHSVINTPLQALNIFLSEYSQYNGTTHAITLQGLVPFSAESPNQPDLSQISDTDLLISTALIEKYCRVINVNGTATVADSHAIEDFYLAISREENIQDEKLTACIAESVVKHRAAMNNKKSQLTPVSSTGLISTFERADFNVVNPFDGSNMLIANSEINKLSSSAVARICKVFTIGAMNLASVLKQSEAECLLSGGLKGFFRSALTRLSGDWRPDAINNTVKMSSMNLVLSATTARINLADKVTADVSVEPVNAAPVTQPVVPSDLFTVSLSTLWQSMLYCNFILESVLTESALMMLSSEILTEKGPLPVGEVGKILTDVTLFPHFTTRLKERFGGLKKYLENYRQHIIISPDHPFNPNVLLKNTITAEQYELIQEGELTIQSVAKARKAANAAAALAKQKPAAVTSTAVKPTAPPQYLSTVLAMNFGVPPFRTTLPVPVTAATAAQQQQVVQPSRVFKKSPLAANNYENVVPIPYPNYPPAGSVASTPSVATAPVVVVHQTQGYATAMKAPMPPSQLQHIQQAAKSGRKVMPPPVPVMHSRGASQQSGGYYNQYGLYEAYPQQDYASQQQQQYQQQYQDLYQQSSSSQQYHFDSDAHYLGNEQEHEVLHTTASPPLSSLNNATKMQSHRVSPQLTMMPPPAAVVAPVKTTLDLGGLFGSSGSSNASITQQSSRVVPVSTNNFVSRHYEGGTVKACAAPLAQQRLRQLQQQKEQQMHMQFSDSLFQYDDLDVDSNLYY